MRIVFWLVLFLSISILGCKKRPSLFKKIHAAHSGILFNNEIIENDSINILDYSNVYNGGGVGIGDFNNDGLQDIYFTGNLVSSKLYLNKGGFKFEDITDKSGTGGEGKWSRGVTVIDINNDGLQDIYVSATISKDPQKRENILYINKGNVEGGVPAFINEAKEYGLADTTHTTQSVFFDYDNDGDLDVYLCVNEIIPDLYPNQFRPVIKDGSFPSTGRLYRNDPDALSGHPYYTNVSEAAGITIEGYGHAANITDINLDGWKDIYVTNDYLSSNILYVNNGDGTFTDKIGDVLKHSSANAMGADINDINNDGLMDIIELDMNPEDNYRKKTMMLPVSYQTYQNSDLYGYHYQYVRNTLQLNQGPRILEGDSVGYPVFADIGYFSGIAETDWSWAPLAADFNNDTYRDILITNGFPKDITDRDFGVYRNETYGLASKEQLLEQIPEVKLHNYIYRNNGNNKFTDESYNWGLGDPTFSNGAAYADFDNDGDLDFVVNNINDKALLYENTLIPADKESARYLQIKLEGGAPNRNGYGTWIKIFYNGHQQIYEHYNVRGYLSTITPVVHFGLDTIKVVDSIHIIWPDNSFQKLVNITTNQVLPIRQIDATTKYDWGYKKFNDNTLLKNSTNKTGIKYFQKDIDYIDFNVQKLMPHKLSEYGPALAAGDLNNDGYDDLVTGGSNGFSAKFFFQNSTGIFDSVDLQPGANRITKLSEDLGIAVFDADNDGLKDIYIASGGYENPANTSHYRDKFFHNLGNNNFKLDTTVFPVNYTSKSCVKAFDYDKDGDLDLFIGGRVEPWRYPLPVSSFLYRNNSKPGKPEFTLVNETIAPSLNNLGLISDALCTDYDNDGWTDLILAGEWMPIVFLKNVNGKFVDKTTVSGIADKKGWWNSLTAGDFDNDGDIDYLAGNLGENSFYKADKEHPVSLYAKDFDNNGIVECIPTRYIKDKKGKLQEYTFHLRDDIMDMVPSLKKNFLPYKTFGETSFNKLFTSDELKGSLKLEANYFSSAFIKNNGNGNFEISPLPGAVQFSSVFGMIAEDFDGDGNLDVLFNCNDFSTDISIGRYDALNGIVAKGDGKGHFNLLTMAQSGFYTPGSGRAVCILNGSNNRPLIATSQNRGPLNIYSLNTEASFSKAPSNATYAEITFVDGRKRRTEFYYGTSFLSQNARGLIKSTQISNIIWFDDKGNSISVK